VLYLRCEEVGDNKIIQVEGIGSGIWETIHDLNFNRAGFDTVRLKEDDWRKNEF